MATWEQWRFPIEKPAFELILFGMIEFVQKRFLKPTQKFCLTDDGYLEVTIKRLLSESQFKFALQELKSEPTRQKAFSKRAFGVSVVFGLLALILAVVAIAKTDHSDRVELFQSAAVWFVCSGLCCLWCYFTRADFIAYFHRVSGEALVVFYTDLPDEKTFHNFISALDARLTPPEKPLQTSKSDFSFN